MTARWTRAGHILGAASIRVTTPDTSILFSGDLGRATHPVLLPRETPPGADTVLVESTYGDREHLEPSSAQHEPLADLIRRTARRGGSVLIPAFATSELKSAFQIGFMIFIPFLVIDIVVSSVLMSLGMMMLSPVLVALPFKLMLFVLADGWNLLIGSLAASFAT